MKSISILAAFLAIVISACGPSSFLTSSWKSPDAAPKPFKKIVVLGLIGDPNPQVREKLEQHIAGDLNALGYTAVCSCNEFSPEAFRGMTEDEAIRKLQGSGVDAVVTVVLLDSRKETYYVPGDPGSEAYDKFYRYYSDRYTTIKKEGYYVTNSKYFWESNFYDLSSGSLLYSARSRTFDPKSFEAMGHEYGQMIVKDMLARDVLADYSQKKPM